MITAEIKRIGQEGVGFLVVADYSDGTSEQFMILENQGIEEIQKKVGTTVNRKNALIAKTADLQKSVGMTIEPTGKDDEIKVTLDGADAIVSIATPVPLENSEAGAS